MALVEISKIDALERLVDAAIRLTFAGGDAVAIHAVIGGAHRIIQEFHQRPGEIETYLRLGDWIAPAHTARFWRYLDASATFLKPGAWDPEASFALEEDANDFMIVFAARWFQRHGHATTRAMRIFATWYVACNPGILRPEAMPEAAITAQMTAMSEALKGFERADRLRAGAMALDQTAVGTEENQAG
jgi:hypothetical protein